METQLIHFDSIDSTYTDPFNARFNLMNPMRDVKRIYLKSFELAINIPNIRNSSTLNQIILKTNLGNTHSVTIAEGNYTTLTSLLTAINNAFVGVIPATTITFAQIGTTNRITCTATTSAFSSFSFTDTALSRVVLGFRNSNYGSLIVNSTVDFLLNCDHYISMYISNINCNNSSYRLQSFKIPLNASNGTIFYDQENTSFKQFIDLGYSNQTFNHLNVQIYDRFNNLILCNNSDYSFTLAFEFH